MRRRLIATLAALLAAAAPAAAATVDPPANLEPPQCRLPTGADPPYINVTFLGPAQAATAGERP